MVIDLFTLYVVIMVKSATLSVLWFAIWRCYRDIDVAKIWLASNLFYVVGGLVLIVESRPGPLSSAIVGNLVVIFGYFLIWVGFCRFYDRPLPWRSSLLATLACALVLVGFQDDRIVRNLTYAVGQGMPLLLSIALLFRERGGRAGALFAAWAAIGTFVAILARAVGMVLHANGMITGDAYSTVLFVTMLGSVFGGLLLNFGFLLLVIDRLHADASALAVIDELTGLANRRVLLQRVSDEVARSRRTGRSFALMVIDLDHFKHINDAHGHAAGDACLAHFSRQAKINLRQTDLLARLGGDEFCLLLPEADEASTVSVASGLAERLRSQPAPWDGRAIALSVSIGIAVWHAGRHVDAATVMEDADRALYAVKRRGRDGHAIANVEEAPPEMPGLAQPGGS